MLDGTFVLRFGQPTRSNPFFPFASSAYFASSATPRSSDQRFRVFLSIRFPRNTSVVSIG